MDKTTALQTTQVHSEDGLSGTYVIIPNLMLGTKYKQLTSLASEAAVCRG